MSEHLRSTRMLLEHTEAYIYCHDELSCRGKYCTLHNRSDHNMRHMPQLWRSDRGLMERLCEHGVGHPDPDEINLGLGGRAVHGCDGCCINTGI